VVLLPALQLARNDLDQGLISPQQQVVVRTAIVRAIEALGTKGQKPSSWRRRSSVLEGDSLGQILRQQRESVSGRWQGPLKVAPKSVVLCIGLGGPVQDLCTEILARILHDLSIDARHLSLSDIAAFDKAPVVEATRDGISMVYLVSLAKVDANESKGPATPQMRDRFPDACIVLLQLPRLLAVPELTPEDPAANHVARSFEQAAQLAIARFPAEDRKAK
jgi:hypothetical protein